MSPRHDFVSTVASVTHDVPLWYGALVDTFTRSIYRRSHAVVGVPTIIRPHIDLPSPEHLVLPAPTITVTCGKSQAFLSTRQLVHFLRHQRDPLGALLVMCVRRPVYKIILPTLIFCSE